MFSLLSHLVQACTGLCVVFFIVETLKPQWYFFCIWVLYPGLLLQTKFIDKNWFSSHVERNLFRNPVFSARKRFFPNVICFSFPYDQNEDRLRLHTWDIKSHFAMNKLFHRLHKSLYGFPRVVKSFFRLFQILQESSCHCFSSSFSFAVLCESTNSAHFSWSHGFFSLSLINNW